MENIQNKSIEIDFEGNTVEEAVKKASETLKISRNNLKVKILSEEQKGLFGMAGAKPAKIRVSIKPQSSHKKKS